MCVIAKLCIFVGCRYCPHLHSFPVANRKGPFPNIKSPVLLLIFQVFCFSIRFILWVLVICESHYFRMNCLIILDNFGVKARHRFMTTKAAEEILQEMQAIFAVLSR